MLQQIIDVIPPESGMWREELALELLQQTCLQPPSAIMTDALKALLGVSASCLPQQLQQYVLYF